MDLSNLRDVWEQIVQWLSNFFQTISSLFMQYVWVPVQRIIFELQHGSLWKEVQYRFKYNTWYNTWNDVLNSSSLSSIATIIFIIAVIVLICSGSGFIGGFIGGLIVTLIIMAIIATIVWLWQNLLLPILPLTIFILASLGLIIGAFVSIRNYIRSIKAYRDPWKDYKDKGRFVEENAFRRSYFFGPGQHQVSCIFRGAWKRNFSSLGDIVSNRVNARGGLILRVLLAPFVWIYLIFHILSVLTFGSVLTLLIGIIHYLFIFFISLVTWIIFSLAWLIDRTYLVFKRISSICPHCKKNYRIPEFACPACGKLQHNLVPSSYGIFYRKCVCGKKLPTAFYNGRGKLDSYCPSCGEALISSDSRQFGLTMVGASSAGKTAIITTFAHLLQEHAKSTPDVVCEIPEAHARKFDQLNRYFRGLESLRGSVVDETTDMYSLLFRLRGGRTKIQFSLYDVAGEVYDTPDHVISYANDMAISQGIVFVLDPLCSPALKEKARQSDHAAVREMSTVLNHFVAFLQTLSSTEKVGQKIRRPLAIIMNKMDSPAVSSYFSLENLRSAISGSSPEKRSALRDSMCRDFLLQIGLSDFLTAVDAQFANVHYYPVSATGGVKRGYAFQASADFMDPFWWIIRQKDSELAEALQLPKEAE